MNVIGRLRKRCAKLLQRAKAAIGLGLVHVDLDGDTSSFVKEALTSKPFWVIVISGSLVCTVPMLVVLAILSVPDSLWPLRLLATVIIVTAWAVFAAQRERSQKSEDEWIPGKEKQKRPFEEEGIYSS